MRAHHIRAACAILALLARPSGVQANMPVVDPKVDLRFRFENLRDYPDFDFYLAYDRGPRRGDRTAHVTRVVSETITRLEGRGPNLSDVYFLAVPRGIPPPSWNPAYRPPAPEPTPGVLCSAPVVSYNALWDNTFVGYVLRFRVSIEDGKLEVTRLPPSVRPLEWALSRLPAALPWMAFGAGLLLAGVLISRHTRRTAVLPAPLGPRLPAGWEPP